MLTDRPRRVLLLLAVVCATFAGEARGEDLPPPRVIDRRTGKDIVPSRAVPAPRAPTQQPSPTTQRPTPQQVPTPQQPSAQAAPDCATDNAPRNNPRWTTPPAERGDQPTLRRRFIEGLPDWRPWRRLGDFREAADQSLSGPLPFVSVHYAFAAERSTSTVTRGADSFDITAFYPVTERLTVGVMGRYLTTEGGVSGGPLVNIRLLSQSENFPSLSVGAVWLLGADQENETHPDTDHRLNVNATLMKEIPVPDDNGLIRALRVGTGIGYNWRKPDRFTDGWEWWIGPQIDLPENISVYGQFTTGCACDASVVAGISWWSPWGVNFTVSVFSCVGERTGFRGGFGDVVVTKRGTGAGPQFSRQFGGQPATVAASRMELGGH